MIALSAIYPIAAKKITEEFMHRGIKNPKVPHWVLYDINHVLHSLRPIFKIEVSHVEDENGEILHNELVRDVTVKLEEDGDKFKRLMSEYQNSLAKRKN